MNFYTYLGLLFLIFIFFLNILTLYCGYKYSKKLKLNQTVQKKSGMQIIEGSMFALLGLLLAFTFSSAINKFDQRRALIIDQANSIGTLYLRLDLLPIEKKEAIRKILKTYLDFHIKAYQAIPDIPKAQYYLKKSHEYQTQVWNKTLSSCKQMDKSYSCLLLIPALNQVLDIENTRVQSMQMHPPIYIFVLLIFVDLVATFFIGSHIHILKEVSILHIAFYSLVISLIIFTIIDMEYPRLGFIRVDSFDQVLINLKNSLN